MIASLGTKTLRFAKNNLSSTELIVTLLCIFIAISDIGCSNKYEVIHKIYEEGMVIIPLGDTTANNLCWSQDSNQIAYMRQRRSKASEIRSEVEVANSVTGAVLFQSEGVFDVNPTWEPLRSTLLFNQTIDHNLSIVQIENTGQQRSTADAFLAHVLLKDGQNWIFRPTGCWLGANMLFAQKVQKHEFRLRLLDLRTGKITIPWNPGENAIYPVASPNSKWISYIALQGGLHKNHSRYLKIMTASGKEIFVNDHSSGVPIDSCWTYDSRYLIYLTQQKSGCEIHRVLVSTGKDDILARGNEIYSPLSISKDGYLIASGYDSHLSIDRIFLFDINTGKCIATSPEGVSLCNPSLSPDGKRFAYVTSDRNSANHEIQIVNASIVKTSGWVTNAKTEHGSTILASESSRSRAMPMGN